MMMAIAPGAIAHMTRRPALLSGMTMRGIGAEAASFMSAIK